MTDEVKAKKKRVIIQLLVKIITTCVLLIAMFTMIIKMHYYNENGMHPAIQRGSLLIAYRIDSPNRNDIVIYKGEHDSVGRLVAFENDVVDVSDTGELLINGVPSGIEVYFPTETGSKVSFPHTVSKNYCFILNDYRPDMNDSRTYGDIPIDSVYGPLLFGISKY